MNITDKYDMGQISYHSDVQEGDVLYFKEYSSNPCGLHYGYKKDKIKPGDRIVVLTTNRHAYVDGKCRMIQKENNPHDYMKCMNDCPTSYENYLCYHKESKTMYVSCFLILMNSNGRGLR